MTRRDHLLSVFRAASSLIVLAGCGAVTDASNEPSSANADGGANAPNAPNAPTSGPTAGVWDLCEGRTNESPLEFLSLDKVTWGAPAPDYVELRDQPYPQPYDGAPQAPLDIVVASTFGTLCSGAKDAVACRAKYAAVRSTTPGGWAGYAGGQIAQSKRFFVFTAGDEVGVVTDIVGVRRLFAAVDGPQEAAILASLGGHRFDCNILRTEKTNVRAQDGGFRLDMLHANDWTCPSTQERRVLSVDAQGVVTVVTSEPFKPTSVSCAGRRPEHFAALTGSGDVVSHTSAADWLARVAELEAASIPAFERLARELAAHGAPADLVLRSERARRDEIRHAEVMTSHATEHGGAPRAIPIPYLPVRSLFEVALENAVEGCVREAYAALVAHVQAARATTPALRESFLRIADDETEHAALAHDCAAWLEGQLTSAERLAVAAARQGAIVQLRIELASAPESPDLEALGLPRRAEGLALLGLIERDLSVAA